VRYEGVRQSREGPPVPQPQLVTASLFTSVSVKLDRVCGSDNAVYSRHTIRRVSVSDDADLLQRLKKLSAQLDSAKQSAVWTVKEVARAKETSEKVKGAATPHRRSTSSSRRPSRARRKT
jgi:hypothetical protein